WHDVAVRPSGQRSRVPGNPKPSFRIKFNYFVPHRTFHDRFLTGVKMLSDTNDPSMIRRRLEDGIYRASGLPASRCVHARAVANAESVRDFVDVVNNAPWASADAAVDVDMFCRFMAAEVATGEADGYVAYRTDVPPGIAAFRSANFRIYPNPNTGKCIVLAWD